MNNLALPAFILLHGQVGFWDEAAYVAAGAAGLIVFVALLISRKGAPRE